MSTSGLVVGGSVGWSVGEREEVKFAQNCKLQHWHPMTATALLEIANRVRVGNEIWTIWVDGSPSCGCALFPTPVPVPHLGENN